MELETRNRIAADELLGEAELALAMADLTTRRDESEVVEHTLARGQRAYGDILRRQAAIDLSTEDASLLQSLLERLRARLHFLGTTV